MCVLIPGIYGPGLYCPDAIIRDFQALSAFLEALFHLMIWDVPQKQ